jgi:hypothetical protein
MIIIRHQAGPLASKEQKIEGNSERITFGRDPDVCDIVYPADATLVARRHFALVKKPSGEWTFDLFGDPFVAMDGKPVDEAQAVRSGARIELGRRGGPSFIIDLVGEQAASKLPVTETQETVEGAHSAAAQAGRSAALARTIGIVGIVLAIVAAGAAGGFYYLGQSEGARLADAVAALTAEQKRAAEQTISKEAKDRLMQAAYLVLTQGPGGSFSPRGTASPIGPDLLATNAHIGAIFFRLKPGEKMYVRAPGHGGAVHEVIEARNHPGDDAFREFERKDPIFVAGTSECATCEPNVLSSSPTYDVATLRIAPGATLSPVLEIASRADLLKMAPGFPLAAAGYPMEQIKGAEVQALAPTPTLSVGIVTSMTDVFFVPTEPQRQTLIHHNLPSTSGSSGSPMIGPGGKLVGFANAGNVYVVPKQVVATGRIPSAALINYGQRADLILDMLDHSDEAKVEADKAYWAKMTEAFKRGIDVIVPILVAQRKPKPEMKAELVSRENYTMGDADKITLKNEKGNDVPIRRQRISLNVTAGRQYLFLGYAENVEELHLYVYVDGKIVDKDSSHHWFPYISYTAQESKTVVITLATADKNVSYTLFQYVYGDAPSS